MRQGRKYLKLHAREAFPSYSFVSTGAYSYQWWKDGNRLGGKKSSRMTLLLNTMQIHGIRIYETVR